MLWSHVSLDGFLELAHRIALGWARAALLFRLCGVTLSFSRSTLRGLRRIVMEAGSRLAFVGGEVLSSMCWAVWVWVVLQLVRRVCRWGFLGCGGPYRHQNRAVQTKGK